MNIVIMGCGKIGADILANLVMEGHDVTVIDRNAEVLSDITNVYDVMTMCGNGTDYDTLMEAGVAEGGIFAADVQENEILSVEYMASKTERVKDDARSRLAALFNRRKGDNA